MPANPPKDMPRISPYLLYEDAAAAADWLVGAFGFRERMRLTSKQGTVIHAELEMDDGVVMLGHPGPEYRSPAKRRGVHGFVYVYVDDVDRHFERAREAGAAVLAEPTDQFYGDRRYSVEDLEGHQWFFAQHTRDVAPEEMEPPED